MWDQTRRGDQLVIPLDEEVGEGLAQLVRIHGAGEATATECIAPMSSAATIPGPLRPPITALNSSNLRSWEGTNEATPTAADRFGNRRQWIVWPPGSPIEQGFGGRSFSRLATNDVALQVAAEVTLVELRLRRDDLAGDPQTFGDCPMWPVPDSGSCHTNRDHAAGPRRLCTTLSGNRSTLSSTSTHRGRTTGPDEIPGKSVGSFDDRGRQAFLDSGGSLIDRSADSALGHVLDSSANDHPAESSNEKAHHDARVWSTAAFDFRRRRTPSQPRATLLEPDAIAKERITGSCTASCVRRDVSLMAVVA